jgi:ferrous iron transport protein B
MTGDKIVKIVIALAGNPNCGKTTIFNQITGEKQSVGNYSGVTVEKVEGRLTHKNVEYNFVDLPGVYSLTSFSKEEKIARDYLLFERPDVVVNVIDASNLERNLFLTLQLKELGIPLVLVFNMCDLAKSRGITFDVNKLSSILGVRIIEAVGTTGEGLEQLTDAIYDAVHKEREPKDSNPSLRYSDETEAEIDLLIHALDLAARRADGDSNPCCKSLGVDWLIDRKPCGEDTDGSSLSYEDVRENSDIAIRRRWIAIKLLENDGMVRASWQDDALLKTVDESISRLAKANVPMAAKIAAERYAIVRSICKGSVKNEKSELVRWSDRADRLLTHPVWGLGVFFIAMYLVFWLTFAIGNYPVSWLETLFEQLGEFCNRIWADSPDSLLRSIIVDGVIGGVGGVLTFFPNIFILFAAISFLEESGYMARGAFLTDRFLRRFGLTGKSFIPMLVGFGCSIPAVMATRIIEDRKSRLATIFIIPLMSCSARFPIYVLVISAFFPEKWQAPVLWCVYFAGIVIAAIVSSILSVTTFREEQNPLLLELPAYHAPTIRTVGNRALERGWQYIRKAGTTILGVSLALWAMSTFPILPQSELKAFEQKEAFLSVQAKSLGVDLEGDTITENKEERDEEFQFESLPASRVAEISELRSKWEKIQNEKNEAALEYSVAGRIGKAFEPVIQFAGFDWRIGTALVGALAAKEVFVAQLGIVFKVGEADENSRTLRAALAENYSPLVGICIIIFSLVGAPCLATLVVVSKETSTRWAIAQWMTLTTIGFVLAVIVYQLGMLFNWGA